MEMMRGLARRRPPRWESSN